MWTHLFAILGLAALCAFWTLFQQWLRRLDPTEGKSENACSGCGACHRSSSAGEDKE